jgi:hypothetical protein
MYIMYKYRTIPNCSEFGLRNDDRYIDILLPSTCSQAFIAQLVRLWIFDPEVRGSYPVGARIFAFLLSFLFFVHSNGLLYYYETFYYLT